MNTRLFGLAIGGAVLIGTHALAQTANVVAPQTTGGKSLGVATPVSSTTTQAMQATKPTSQGLLGSFGPSLQDLGISVHGVFLDAFAANPNMGAYPNNTVNSGILIPNVDVNLRRLGLSGTTLHFAYTIYTLKSNTPTAALQFGDMVGGYLGLPIPNSNQLTKMTIEQKLSHDRLDIEVGKMSPVRVFAEPNCGNIQACISDPVLTADASEMPFVYSVWGGRVKYSINKALYVQTAAFEDNWLDNFHNGIHWGTSNATGALTMAEAGYKTTYATAAYPSDFEFGGFYNTSGKGTPKGFPLAYIPQLHAYPYDGGKGIFLRAQKVVYRTPGPFEGPFPKNVTLFGAADAAVDGPQPSVFTGWVGANATGFIPGRPFDTLGLQLTYNRISSKEVDFENGNRAALGYTSDSQSPNEFVLIVDSHHQLRSWLGLEFSAQYFINPNQFYDELGTRNPRNGFVTTANLIISLGPLLGTSSSPF